MSDERRFEALAYEDAPGGCVIDTKDDCAIWEDRYFMEVIQAAETLERATEAELQEVQTDAAILRTAKRAHFRMRDRLATIRQREGLDKEDA